MQIHRPLQILATHRNIEFHQPLQIHQNIKLILNLDPEFIKSIYKIHMKHQIYMNHQTQLANKKKKKKHNRGEEEEEVETKKNHRSGEEEPWQWCRLRERWEVVGLGWERVDKQEFDLKGYVGFFRFDTRERY